MNDILILTTGGTIDKLYFDQSSAYQIGDSIVGKVLATARVLTPFRIVELMRKDSLTLTGGDRGIIADAVASAAVRRIVITHGTDTMTETAAALGEVVDKVVVLTGALSPARFAERDASFNLGMAIAAVQFAGPGVYIAMNGRMFAADKVRKDPASNSFVDN